MLICSRNSSTRMRECFHESEQERLLKTSEIWQRPLSGLELWVYYRLLHDSCSGLFFNFLRDLGEKSSECEYLNIKEQKPRKGFLFVYKKMILERFRRLFREMPIISLDREHLPLYSRATNGSLRKVKEIMLHLRKGED